MNSSGNSTTFVSVIHARSFTRIDFAFDLVAASRNSKHSEHYSGWVGIERTGDLVTTAALQEMAGVSSGLRWKKIG